MKDALEKFRHAVAIGAHQPLRARLGREVCVGKNDFVAVALGGRVEECERARE